MFNTILSVIIILGFGVLGGFFGGIGFAYVVAKMLDKKIQEYVDKI
jgi:mannose/fructose/N-acetylgalactosamine-specific phosphotransferase system component IIC